MEKKHSNGNLSQSDAPDPLTGSGTRKENPEFSGSRLSKLQRFDDFVLVCDARGVPILFNDPCSLIVKQILGVEMVAGIEPEKLLKDPEALTFWETTIQQAINSKITKATCSQRFADGWTHQFELNLTPISNGRETAWIIAVGKDITGRHDSEQALIESEDRFRILFDSCPVAMVITDSENWMIVDLNQELCSIGNLRKEDLIGASTRNLPFFTGDNQDRFMLELKTLGLVNGMEMEVVDRAGASRTFRISSRLITLSGLPHIISSFVDISDTKKLEMNLHQSQKMEAIGTLTAGIAHDYNNMLTVILGNLSLAKQIVGKSGNISGYLDSAEKASLKIKRLTAELMSLSRGGILELKPGNLQVLLGSVNPDVSPEQGIWTRKIIPNNLWPILHDYSQLRFVFRNILTNAAESMPGGGEIVLEAKNVNITRLQTKKEIPMEEGVYVKISITDQGVGIPRESLPKIFDPYFSTKEKGEKKGLGLSLATSYNVIKKHNGFISIESEAGKGTIVTIYLPALADPARAHAPA